MKRLLVKASTTATVRLLRWKEMAVIVAVTEEVGAKEGVGATAVVVAAMEEHDEVAMEEEDDEVGAVVVEEGFTNDKCNSNVSYQTGGDQGRVEIKMWVLQYQGRAPHLRPVLVRERAGVDMVEVQSTIWVEEAVLEKQQKEEVVVDKW